MKLDTGSARYTWLGSVASLLAVLTCCGPLVIVALLGVIGVHVTIEESTLVRYITPLLVLALLGMGYSFWVYRKAGPPLLGSCSIFLLGLAFYTVHSETLEIVGFVGLIGASIWDVRVKKKFDFAQEST